MSQLFKYFHVIRLVDGSTSCMVTYNFIFDTKNSMSRRFAPKQRDASIPSEARIATMLFDDIGIHEVGDVGVGTTIQTI